MVLLIFQIFLKMGKNWAKTLIFRKHFIIRKNEWAKNGIIMTIKAVKMVQMTQKKGLEVHFNGFIDVPNFSENG